MAIEREVCKCLHETTNVQETIVGILWEAAEGDWDDARHSVEYRLKPAIKKLEICIDAEGEMLYEDDKIGEMIHLIGKKDLDGLMSLSKSFVAILPADVCCFLKGMWPYKPELRVSSKWRFMKEGEYFW